MRIGFLGGNGHHYLRHAVSASPHDFTIAVAGDGFDNDSAKSFAGRLPSAAWFDDAQRLLDEFQPDAVSIGAVYGHNGELAALALERDIAVVSDKPIAATWSQLERLRQLTENRVRILLTEFPFRSQSEFRAARQVVVDGTLGEVALVTAQKSYRFGASRPNWYARRCDYAGTMLWVASHGIDAVRFCGGQAFKRVVGIQGNLSRPDYAGMEDHCVAMFELANGGSAVVHADFLRPSGAASHGDDRLRIAGSKGVVEVRDGRCLLMLGDTPEADITDSVVVQPIQHELLAAVRGAKCDWYSTADSLAVAEILLHARDGADERSWKSLQ
ncbi:MAG TPA: Gfo/Idh/MocA family oxidoreductase [Abditibacteriaceae bacterium]|jgi:predicted dehydrogenase